MAVVAVVVVDIVGFVVRFVEVAVIVVVGCNCYRSGCSTGRRAAR